MIYFREKIKDRREKKGNSETGERKQSSGFLAQLDFGFGKNEAIGRTSKRN